MASDRQQNWLGSQRVDLPHLRSIESGVSHDLDVLAGAAIAGKQNLIVSGFAVVTSPSPIGLPAPQLTINTAGSIMLLPAASENGTAFSVPANRPAEILDSANVRVVGGFTALATNYISIDVKRSSDPTTTDLVEFIDADTNTENPETVPLARTIDYFIVVSPQDFSTNQTLTPIAIVVTDVANNVVSIQDARPLLGRLATGGTIPDLQSSFGWSGGRNESTSITPGNFTSGDKAIQSLKGWMDAMMSRVQEIGGGAYWYSSTADRNVTMARLGTTFSNGEYFEWDLTNLHWKGLKFVFDNSTGWYNDIKDVTSDTPGLTHLLDGECVYVDLDRTQNIGVISPPFAAGLQPQKSSLILMGTPTVPGARQIIAWRIGAEVFTRGVGWPVGSSYNPATGDSTSGPGALGVVRLTGRPMEDGGWTDNLTPEAVMADVTGQAVATGLTRGLAGTNTIIPAGALSIAAGINDTGLNIGQGATFTSAFTGQITATNNNNADTNAIIGTGNGLGVGGYFTSGTTDGNTGVYGTSSATNGIGVSGLGTGTQPGGYFTGAPPFYIYSNLNDLDLTGLGVLGAGGLGSGYIGVIGLGDSAQFIYGDDFGSHAGGYFVGGDDGNGIISHAGGAGTGVSGIGGATDGSIGITGTSLAVNGIGVQGLGTGFQSGGVFTGGDVGGTGVVCSGGATGVGISAGGEGDFSAGVFQNNGNAPALYTSNSSASGVSLLALQTSSDFAAYFTNDGNGGCIKADNTALPSGNHTVEIYGNNNFASLYVSQTGIGNAIECSSPSKGGKILLFGGNPATSDPHVNQLTAANIPKAFGYCGAGGGLVSGFNVLSSVLSNATSPRSYLVTLPSSSGITNACIVATDASNVATPISWSVVILSNTQFYLRASQNGVGFIDAGAGSYTVSFIVFGHQ